MVTLKQAPLALSLGALGIVFGDIGTSPLYALQAVFGAHGLHLARTEANVFGVISLIIWSITLVVTIKYLIFIMRADNEGEGGILALVALIKGGSLRPHRNGILILVGLVGVSLFYGDSVITPAISVLSAVEGMGSIAPSLTTAIIPLTLLIISAFFLIQRFGTRLIARYFGPVMFIWFISIGAAGATELIRHPRALASLSPFEGLALFTTQPLIALLAMSAVILAVTGAEALYADMGHFGRAAIARAWLLVVFPALALCYMGQGAVLLYGSGATGSSFFHLFPAALSIPEVLLATVATLIASQSVVSGAFSLTRQAIQLGFIPRLRILHTSVSASGQIYIPFINWLIYGLVVILVITFGSSARLGSAYGVAVSGTLLIDSVLFLMVTRGIWHSSRLVTLAIGLLFIPLDILFVVTSTPKVLSGGWFPLVVALAALIIITTWTKGEEILTRERRRLEGPVLRFVEGVSARHPPIKRSDGVAVFIGHHPDFTPLALRATVNDLHELPRTTVIVSVQTTNAAHIAEQDRATFDRLGHEDGICQVKLCYGFHDPINVPLALKNMHSRDPERIFSLEDASYFVSLSKVIPSRSHEMALWRKKLFALLARNELSTSDYYRLPIDRTEEMTTLMRL